jgi:hypothetical protein
MAGSCVSFQSQVAPRRFDAGHAEVDGAGSAQRRDGVADLLLLFAGEVVEVGFDAADELA